MNRRNYEFDTFNDVVTFEPIDSMIIFFNLIQIGWSKKIESLKYVYNTYIDVICESDIWTVDDAF